jgi:hypothetical protein
MMPIIVKRVESGCEMWVSQLHIAHFPGFARRIWVEPFKSDVDGIDSSKLAFHRERLDALLTRAKPTERSMRPSSRKVRPAWPVLDS